MLHVITSWSHVEPFLALFQAPYNNVRYMLLGEAAITQYFMIDAESGEVSLRKSLMDDPNNRESYGVRNRTETFVVCAEVCTRTVKVT